MALSPSREKRKATCNAIGQGRPPKATSDDAYKCEVLTEIPKAPDAIRTAYGEKVWKEACDILIKRKVLKPAHFNDLVNYCNGYSYLSQIDSRLKDCHDRMLMASDEELKNILALISQLTKLRDVHVRMLMTISSRFGFDALSERRFSVVSSEKPKSPENGFLEL